MLIRRTFARRSWQNITSESLPISSHKEQFKRFPNRSDFPLLYMVLDFHTLTLL